MDYRRLGQTDMNVSKIGFGGTGLTTFYLDCDFKNDERSLKKAQRILELYFQHGCNYIDTSPWYANSEYFIGEFLKGRPRSSYYIATKAGRYDSDKEIDKWFDFSYKRTIQSVENSIKTLNCDYIDLIQVHDFEFAHDFDQIINETLPALDDLRKQGKVRYIGINSYVIETLRKCLEQSHVKIDTVLTFAHLCLDDSSLLGHIQYFREKNVGIINASPLSMGLFTELGPPKWHRAPDEVKEKVLEAFQYCKSKGMNLKKLDFLYSVNNPQIDMTISSAANEESFIENVKFLKEGLSVEEEKMIEYLREEYFIPLNYKGFGYTDVELYFEKLNKFKQGQ